jgi:hypothetical protein
LGIEERIGEHGKGHFPFFSETAPDSRPDIRSGRPELTRSHIVDGADQLGHFNSIVFGLCALDRFGENL